MVNEVALIDCLEKIVHCLSCDLVGPSRGMLQELQEVRCVLGPYVKLTCSAVFRRNMKPDSNELNKIIRP